MRARTHANPFAIRHRFDEVMIKPEAGQALDIEIGFGRGVFLRYWAQKYAERCIVGIEVRKSIVKVLQERLLNMGIDSVQLFHGNGQIFCEDSILDRTVDKVFVFHPDPWFKKRHHKRRVITTEFLRLLSTKLKVGGRIYISTDVEELFYAMQDSFKESGVFEAVDDVFWSTDYQSHWDTFSETDNRERFVQAYQLVI